MEEITFLLSWKKEDLLHHLKDLRRQRGEAYERTAKKPRSSLRRSAREIILRKTGGRCHICGGLIDTRLHWEVDHVLCHAVGGGSELDNYLAAHGLCNTCRWYHLPLEMQWIMKIGVWARKQMEGESELGKEMLVAFFENERRREMRKKANRQAPAPPDPPQIQAGL